MSKHFLAFDLGASSGRAIIGTLEHGKLTLTEVHRFANGPTEKEGSIYWDYPALCGELKTGLKKALAVQPELDGIGIDTWGVDYVFFDRATGEPRRWPYHYRDTRTEQGQKAVWAKLPAKELYLESGIQCMVFNTVYQLTAHYHTHPEDFENSYFLPMPDALAVALGGDRTAEYTHVSTMDLLNPEKREWSDKIISRLGLPRSVFPTIVQPGTFGGTLSKELQKELNCGPIPIIKIGSHDTASAVAAVPAKDNTNWAYISAGTWALLGAELKHPLVNEASAGASFTNEGGVEHTIRFLTNVMGSWLFQETRRIWNEQGNKLSFADMEQLARAAKPGKFLVNPNDPEFFTPGDMPARIVSFCEKTKQGTPANKGEIVRAIYDSLALYFAKRLGVLAGVLHTDYHMLNIVGGGTKDGLLMQLTADALNFPVAAGPVEATAIGNVLVQAMATGDVASLSAGREVVRNSFDIITYQPNAEMHALYTANSERFDQLAK